MLSSVFDKIYVVSLPSSTDRRKHISAQLAAINVAEFEWHDASSPASFDVKTLFGEGLVHSFPPCFRCGRESCGRNDCNNVLIPEQVAVFASYLALWRKIAQVPQRALVLEDDVVFHQSLPRVIQALNEWQQDGALDFRAEIPRLLRLGWALGDDHEDNGAVRLVDSIRMSNPCHGITSAFAQKAINRFRSVYHTADVYLHSDLPEEGEALTVLPPIASELSWGVGKFDSLIHPKNVRAEYLERQGHMEAAGEIRKRVQHHFTSVAHKNIEKDQ